jgi:mannose-6-phosphate isomerase-like protein (cupin superfamily)
VLTKKNQAKKFKQPACEVLEYGGTEKIDIAVARIKGRYPESGKARNKKCTMMYYVLAGEGKAIIEKESFRVGKGDVILFRPKRWYWVEGSLEVLIASSPRWSPDQYEHRDVS